MLNVCASASDNTFATTGDVLLALYGATTTQVVASTGEINYLGQLVQRASAWAETYIGYPLGLQVYSESVAAFGGRRLMLSRTPIRAVLRLLDSTTTSAANSLGSSEFIIEDREAGFLARDQGFSWTEMNLISAGDFNLGLTGALLPNLERKSWLVEYVAGYAPLGGLSTDSPAYTTQWSTSTGSTLPDDVRHAVTLKAVEMQMNPLGVVSRRVGDLAVDYLSARPGSGGVERLTPAQLLLAPYRRLA